ncbi:MAG: methyltransferase domain-containing protein [Chlamydiota bacterium]
MSKKWIGCFFLFLSCLRADDTYFDTNIIRAYVHNSDMQRRWAVALLAPHLKGLKGEERILDVGCGDGKITADISTFVPNGIVFGIDPSKAMLDWAKKQYSSLEYPNLFFQKGGLLHPNLSEPFDLIFSSCALQHCMDQYTAFKNLAKLLKPYGKLVLSVPAMDNAAWKQARKNVQSLFKWAPYWQNVAPRMVLTVEEYIELLEEVGLHPKRVEKIVTVDPFIDRLEFMEFLIGTLAPVVPEEKVQEFYQELITEYIRLLPEALLANGVLEIRFGRIEIEALKK